MKLLVAQLCPTLCDPMDCSPADSSVYGVLQARIQDYTVFSNNNNKYSVLLNNYSVIIIIIMEGILPFPFPGDLPDPGIEPRSPAFQADSLPSEPPGKTLSIKWKCP